MIVLLTRRRLTPHRAAIIKDALDHPPTRWGWLWLRIRHGVTRSEL